MYSAIPARRIARACVTRAILYATAVGAGSHRYSTIAGLFTQVVRYARV